jgi:trigger factor
MNIGEERDITVKFPEEYHAENLKGKDAVFHIVLHEIKATELPEINDDFIKEADGAESLDAYKEKKSKELQDANDKRAQRELEDAIVKKITANAEMEIPDAMIENQIDHMVQEMEYRFMYQGLRLEDYLKYTKQTLEQYREGFKEQAGEIVKQQLVIDKILTVEGIDATEEEVEEKIKDMAEKQGKKVPEFKKGLPEKQLEYLKNEIIITKLFDFLKKENTIA